MSATTGAPHDAANTPVMSTRGPGKVRRHEPDGVVVEVDRRGPERRAHAGRVDRLSP